MLPTLDYGKVKHIMSARRIRVLIAIVVVLVGLGGVLLYVTGRGALLWTLVEAIAAVIAIVGVLWVIVTGVVHGDRRFLEEFNPLECCSFLGVLGVTSVVTVGTVLLRHSLLVAILAGGSIMVMMLIVLCVAAASYRQESQSSY